MAAQITTVDEYIASCPDDVQEKLGEIRRRLRGAVPDAGETISYGIPTMTLHGRHLVYFWAWKHHIAVYPVPAADQALEQEIAPYRVGKGTLRFPLRKPIPYDLIERLAPTRAVQRRARPAAFTG
ncbi:MAG TPA: DUF1801 domain-containing protein [Streptosporangiaceae bacterium]|nr:DUF1801 domain-containing protein [Streptosporangiaceae bacterium]